MDNLIEGRGLCVQFPGEPEPLFSGIDIFITSGVHALIGRNGVGKSCLAAILAGERAASDGQVQQHCRVGYLAQHGQSAQGSVADALGVSAVQQAGERILSGVGSAADFDFMADKWTWEANTAALLASVGFDMDVLSREMASLSGGEQTRIQLLALQRQGCRCLILDEPSNHLDANARQWLADWLSRFSGGVLLVTHDRVLLDKVAVIYELSGLGLARSQGGWQTWLNSREQLRLGAERDVAQAKKQWQQAKREQQSAREKSEQRQSRGRAGRIDANQSKIALDANKGRAQATQSRHAKLHEDRVERVSSQRVQAEAQLEQLTPLAIVSAEPESARDPLLHLAALVLPYGRQKPISLTLNQGQRLAVVGENGSGKSTLLRVLIGDLSAAAGEVSVTASRRLMDQHLSLLELQQSALENFSRLSPGWTNDVYRTRLAQLRIAGDAAVKPVHTLSGGEQLKVALACLFCGPSAPALLLLDEPDNHLDMESKVLLQQALRDYRGAMLVVSHDRHFLDGIGGFDYFEL